MPVIRRETTQLSQLRQTQWLIQVVVNVVTHALKTRVVVGDGAGGLGHAVKSGWVAKDYCMGCRMMVFQFLESPRRMSLK